MGPRGWEQEGLNRSAGSEMDHGVRRPQEAGNGPQLNSDGPDVQGEGSLAGSSVLAPRLLDV